MKFYISIFLVISSCTILNNDRAQKIYICGDHVCNSKKERNEYFKNNISLEVYSISPSDKKDRDFDLVELNMSKEQKEEIFSTTNQKKLINEDLKKRKKLAKIRIKEGENVIRGSGTVIDGKSNLIHSNGRFTAVIGLNDLVVVNTDDATLIMPKDKSERVKDLVRWLGSKKHKDLL